MRRRAISGYNCSMEFFLNDDSVTRLPPAETRLLDLRAEPSPDGKRLHVTLELTPFQQRPYIELVLTDPEGQVAASTSIVEPVGWKLELNLHIRRPDRVDGDYTLTAVLSYPEPGEIDRRTLTVALK